MPISLTADRIRARRKELGLSADIVATAIGVSRATMFRYENGDIEKVPVSLIPLLAKALHTTPSYLMGWDNTFAQSEQNEVAASAPPAPGEAKLTALYHQLNPEGQEKLVGYADDLVSSGKYIKSHPSRLAQKQA